jgi:gliding motility-associated-like protein
MKKNILYLVVAMLCITIFKKQLYAQNLIMNGNFETGSAPTYNLNDFNDGMVSNWNIAQYNGDNCGSNTAYHFAGGYPCGAADYVSNAVDGDYIRVNNCPLNPPANRFASLSSGSVSHPGGFCHHTGGIITGLQKNGQAYTMIPGHTYTLKIKLRVGNTGDPTLRVHFAKFGVNWNANPNTSQNVRWRDAATISMNHNSYNNCLWYSFDKTFVVPAGLNGMQNMILYLEDNNSTSDSPTIAIDDVELYDIGCCIPYKLIENSSSLSSLTKTSDYIKAGFDAGIPNSSGNVTVVNGQNVNFRAGNLINLLPGFSVQNGAGFRAALEYCTGESENTGEISVAFWPNVFTPNGDGINDNYCVNVTGATQFSIQVFDSWGALRFDDSGIISNSFACIWNGDCNQNCSSSKVPNGTYYCVIKFFNCSGSIEHAENVSIFGSPGIKTNDNAVQNQLSYLDVKSPTNIYDPTVVSGIDELNTSVDFVISPNPSTGIFKLSFVNDQAKDISILDVLGNQLKSISAVTENVLSIDLTEYASGFYYIEAVYKSGQKKVKKIIKN